MVFIVPTRLGTSPLGSPPCLFVSGGKLIKYPLACCMVDYIEAMLENSYRYFYVYRGFFVICWVIFIKEKY